MEFGGERLVVEVVLFVNEFGSTANLLLLACVFFNISELSETSLRFSGALPRDGSSDICKVIIYRLLGTLIADFNDGGVSF